MSRTDKDRPYRVKVTDSTLPLIEHHTHHAHYAWSDRHPEAGCWSTKVEHGCDLPDLDDPSAAEHATSAGRHACCTRDVAWWSAWRSWRSHGVPRWYRQHTWYEPERARERDVLREAAKEYNGSGDLDGYDLPNHQHRHRGRWWWD